MHQQKIVFISSSFGPTNGIANFEKNLRHELPSTATKFVFYGLHYEFSPGKYFYQDGVHHIAACDAFDIFLKEFQDTDIVQFNGGLDPLSCCVAAYAGVPTLIEILHQIEIGGLHPATDAIICVSEFVKKEQCFSNPIVIPNGIDCNKFYYQEGWRFKEKRVVVQVSNNSKELYCELGEVANDLAKDPNCAHFEAYTVGNRSPIGKIIDLGVCTNMPEIYHNADFLFLLETKSAFGLVFAEAMACGTLPIIASSSGACTFVEHEKNGWILDCSSDQPIKKQANAMLKNILSCVSDNQFIAMQRNARQCIEKSYSLDGMILKYLDLWDSFANKKRKKSQSIPSWMNFTLASLFYNQNNPIFLQYLNAYFTDQRPLEPYFLKHPMGAAVINFYVKHLCPALISRHMQFCVQKICQKFRDSHCIFPELDFLEKNAQI